MPFFFFLQEGFHAFCELHFSWWYPFFCFSWFSPSLFRFFCWVWGSSTFILRFIEHPCNTGSAPGHFLVIFRARVAFFGDFSELRAAIMAAQASDLRGIMPKMMDTCLLVRSKVKSRKSLINSWIGGEFARFSGLRGRERCCDVTVVSREKPVMQKPVDVTSDFAKNLFPEDMLTWQRSSRRTYFVEHADVASIFREAC